MSGVIFASSPYPMPPYVDDRLRLVMVNGSQGVADAHLSFPYLGVRGEPVPSQLISRDRPRTDNMYAAAYFRSTASTVHSIELTRDSSNVLHVSNWQNMAWAYNFPNGGTAGNGADIVIMPVAPNNYEPAASTTEQAQYTVFPRRSEAVDSTDWCAVRINSSGSSGEKLLNGDAGMFHVGYLSTGSTSIDQPMRYCSVHYLLRTSIVNGPSSPNFYDAIRFHASPENGTLGGFEGSSLPLYDMDPVTGEETEADSWHHRCRLVNPSHPNGFTCVRYTNNSTLPSICPDSGEMMAYMRMDMQTSSSTSYISISMPTVGITLPNFNYNTSAPNTRLKISLQYSLFVCSTNHTGGFIFNDDNFHQPTMKSLSCTPSDTPYTIEENVGGFKISLLYYSTGNQADVRIQSVTGASISVGTCKIFSSSRDSSNTTATEQRNWEITNTKTLSNITVSDSSPTTIFNYSRYVLTTNSQTYTHVDIRYGSGYKNRLEIQFRTAGSSVLYYRTILYEVT